MRKKDKKFLKRRGATYYLNAPGRGPRGKDLVKSLKTTSLDLAIARRDVMLTEAKSDGWSELEKLTVAKRVKGVNPRESRYQWAPVAGWRNG